MTASGIREAELGQWRLAARCREEDAEIFFPATGERGTVRGRREARAKAVCRRCTVVDDCLAYALATGQQHGVWGATTPRDRAARSRHGGETVGFGPG